MLVETFLRLRAVQIPAAIATRFNSQLLRCYSAKPNFQHYSYGGRHTVTLIPGDGVYQELMGHVKEVFRYMGAPIDFEEVDMQTTEDMGGLLTAIKRNGVALKGSVETKLESFEQSKNVLMRKDLDLYANIVCCKSLPEVATRHDNIDLVIIRENTEGEYSQLEHENVPGVVESLKIITKERSQRIAEFAFQYAEDFNRKKVTCIHKANIMKLADGLFLKTCADVAKNFPEIEFNDMIVDNCSMQMVSRPQQFDVMVMPNLYGNIISNIAAGLVGGPGLVSGINLGEKYAVFESGTRNTGSSIAGMNIANPVAVFFAAADMLEYLNLDRYSQMLRSSTLKSIVDDNIRTPDLGGSARTSEVVDAVIRNVQSQTNSWFQEGQAS